MSVNTTTLSQPTVPQTAMTTWERHEAGFPARDKRRASEVRRA